MSQDVEIHNLAVRIYDALNQKGAGLGNASIGIIEGEIEKSAQQCLRSTLLEDQQIFNLQGKKVASGKFVFDKPQSG